MFHCVCGFLLLSVAAITAQIIKPCAIKPGPFQESWWAILPDKLQHTIRNDSHNLFHQIARNPCLQLQYYGASLSLASHLTLYGTCNYERMFRFTAKLYVGHCWLSELSVWDQRSLDCESHEITEDYKLDFPTLEETASGVKINLCSAGDGACMERANPAAECLCNATDWKQPKMAEFWRDRQCQQQQQRKDPEWMLDPARVSGLVLLILGNALAGLVLMRWAAPPLDH